MFTYSENFAIVQSFDEIFWGGSFKDVGPSDPYKVTTDWVNKDTMSVSARGYYKEIKAKDTFLDTLLGKSWEASVHEAQREAFKTAYQKVEGEKMREYQTSKFN